MINKYVSIQISEAAKGTDSEFVIALLAATASLIVAALTVYFSRKNHKEMLADKRTEERKKEIYKILNEFYGPFQQYLNTSNEFYRILTKDKPKGFRTLPYLLNNDATFQNEDGTYSKAVLSEADREILNQIVAIGEKLEALIVEKAGLIDDPVLRNDFVPNLPLTDVTLEKNGLLAIARAHFQIIRLAHAGVLTGETEKFKDYVFPRELPVKIEERIQKLQQELKELNSTS